MAKPNLLIIHTDQLSSWALSCYGAKGIETPNIDRIANEGVAFNNFFTNSAWCTPSRGIMFSGRYPHCNGAYANNIELNRDEITFGKICQDDGYKTGYFGKWHLDGDSIPGWVHKSRSMGFEACRYMHNRGCWKNVEDMPENSQGHKPNPIVTDFTTIGDEKTFPTDFFADRTINFINEHKNENFCCVYAVDEPHPAHIVRSPYDTMFRPEDMEIPETFYQEKIPEWADNPRSHGAYVIDFPDREKILRQTKAQYFGQVKCIDDNVGKILKSLEDNNLLDSTVIVFTTDHGEYMGEHTIKGKDNIYETAYRIPLLIRFPEKIKSGTKVDKFVTMVDFQQTILDIMDLSPSGREQGRSALPLIKKESNIDWKEEVHLYHGSCERAGLITPEYTIAFVKDSEHVLFDRIQDPLQKENLFNNENKKALIKTLHARVLKHHRIYASPAAEWLCNINF